MTIQRKPNRRDFVKGSAAAAGAAIAGGLSVARGAHAAGGDQIKIALIGCGGRGTGAASQCLSVPNENIKLIAVADAFEDSAVRSLGILRGRCGDKVDVSPDRVFAGFDAYNLVPLPTAPTAWPARVAASPEGMPGSILESTSVVTSRNTTTCWRRSAAATSTMRDGLAPPAA